MSAAIDTIIQELRAIGAIKFGEFRLKNGTLSPIYIDLRLIISSPPLLMAVAESLWEKISDCQLADPIDLICGIPYTALPIATCLSLVHHLPMIMRRKEKKSYGTQQAIEGKFQPGQSCLLIEDVITSGASILETASDCNAAGLITRHVAVFLDREQGGKEKLQALDYKIHAVVTLSEVLCALQRMQSLTASEEKIVAALLLERV